MGVLGRIGRFFLSLRTSLWLLGAQLALFLIGAFSMPARPEFETINLTALFTWLAREPLGATWWLWASVLVLFLLAVNTVACSIESLMKKRAGRHWVLVFSPQVIHAGFMLMLVAHLASALGSSRATVAMGEGMFASIADRLALRLVSVDFTAGPGGYLTDWSAKVEFYSERYGYDPAVLAPNRPSYRKGAWIYLKEVRPFPARTAVIEISREPGALWALAGAALFTVGTLSLLALKVRRDR